MLTVAAAALLAAHASPSPAAAAPATFFVSPAQQADGDGGSALAAGGGPDGLAAGQRHFRTLRAARDAIRQLRRRSAAPNVTVLIAPGTYPLTQQLILTEADSFTTWKAAGRAKPVHSGGRVLNGTWSAPAKPGGPWTMALPAQTPRFNQLFVSGERATRAREPEWGTYYQMEAELPAPHTGKGFIYRGHDLAPLVGQGGADGAELVVYNSWQASRRNIAAVNASSRSVLLTSDAAIAIEPYASDVLCCPRIPSKLQRTAVRPSQSAEGAGRQFQLDELRQGDPAAG